MQGVGGATIEPGSFVDLRGRPWLVEEVRGEANDLQTLILSCISDDAQGERLEILWDAEIGAAVLDEDGWRNVGAGLATLARDHEFTFLDHALKCGDSLVGLTREQIASLHWGTREGLPLFSALVRERFEAAVNGRREIREAPDDVARALQEVRYQHVESRLDKPSMNSKTAWRACACVLKRLRSSNSHSSVAKKLSAIALS